MILFDFTRRPSGPSSLCVARAFKHAAGVVVGFAAGLSALAPGLAWADQPDSTVVESTELADLRRREACTVLARAPWPGDAGERRSLIQRLEARRERCMDHAAFLAALGGYWLEDGNPVQALLWLERSLLLDPNQLGARADYALALAALGERAALEELLKEWGGRTDLPPLLFSRLLEADARKAAPASQAERELARGRWVQVREVSLLFGHETNLDRSPRLSILTITPPDGPVELELDEPLKPRPGAAATAELSWHGAYSPASGSIVQAGVQGTARMAPGNSATDWHHVQVAVAAAHRWGEWRAEAQASVSGVGGALNEPYRLVRWGASIDRIGFGCNHRMSFDIEMRSQTVTTLADSRSTGGGINLQCPMPKVADWTVGAALRVSTDVPLNSARAGGTQRQWSLGLRAAGPIGTAGRVDVNLRLGRAIDAAGYNPNLAFDARRWLNPVQLSLEYTHPAASVGVADAELIAQLQAIRQGSNLPVFQYSSVGLFGGLRWKW